MPIPCSVDDLYALFRSSGKGRVRGQVDGYHALADMMLRGLVTAEEVPYNRTAEPDSASHERTAFEGAFLGAGGERHGWLKWWAYNWLRERGEPAPLYEQRTQHGIADVYGPTLGYMVECGDTAPEKLLMAWEGRRCGEFVLFPFSDEPVAIVFRITEEGVAELESQREQRLQTMAEAIRRRRPLFEPC